MKVRQALRVEEYDADDADAVEAGWSVLSAAETLDAPFRPPDTLFRRSMEVRHGWDGSPVRFFVASVDGLPVAIADLDLPEWDNRDLAWAFLAVHPEHRRRGHGTALLAELREVARQAGRTKFGAAWWETPGSEPFAHQHGLARASQEIYRVQRPEELPPGLVDAAYDASLAHAGDYELTRFEGRSPDDLLPAIAQITSVINDAPLDDLDIEDEVFTVDRIRDYESAQLDGGNRLYRIIARHRATGDPAGHTVVVVDTERPTLAHQHDTAVARTHRGHRLGMLLKADMLRWLADVEPQITSIDTFNAESNDHMIAVNERLGYRALGRVLEFQVRPAVSTYDAGTRPPR
jgi:GNAT superfamily N-acetyltransferase